MSGSVLRTKFAIMIRSLIFSAGQGSNEDTYIEKRLSLIQILDVRDRIAFRARPFLRHVFSLASSFTIFNDTCT